MNGFHFQLEFDIGRFDSCETRNDIKIGKGTHQSIAERFMVAFYEKLSMFLDEISSAKVVFVLIDSQIMCSFACANDIKYI